MHQEFWREQPALLFGLSLLVGTGSYLFWPSPWNGLWPILWVGYLIWLRAWPLILLVIGGVLYSWSLYYPPPQAQSGYFSISSLQPYQTPFQKGLLYKGMLYIDNKRIPCSIRYNGFNHPPAHCDYIVTGQLHQRDSYCCFFKAEEWKAVEKTWSLAELRHQTKEKLRRFLEKKLKNPRTASFLGSLLTGDVEDRQLRYDFARLGLQHLLAISGFHFAILMAFCSFFVGLFLPYRTKLICLLIAINLYFVFVGSLPAVQRSWLIALLYLLGKLLYRHSSGLNLLGAALLIEIMLDPLISASLGFQLSFVSCAGILLLRPFFTQLLTSLLPYHRASHLTLFAQHGYLFTSFLREALSINLAVNTALLPLLLFHFHKFPLLSLLYNLFFPFLLSGVLFLLLLTLILYLSLPLLALPLFSLTDFLTDQLLQLISYPPFVLDYSLTTAHFPPWIIPPYLLLLLHLSLLYKREKERREGIVTR